MIKHGSTKASYKFIDALYDGDYNLAHLRDGVDFLKIWSLTFDTFSNP